MPTHFQQPNRPCNYYLPATLQPTARHGLRPPLRENGQGPPRPPPDASATEDAIGRTGDTRLKKKMTIYAKNLLFPLAFPIFSCKFVKKVAKWGKMGKNGTRFLKNSLLQGTEKGQRKKIPDNRQPANNLTGK